MVNEEVNWDELGEEESVTIDDTPIESEKERKERIKRDEKEAEKNKLEQKKRSEEADKRRKTELNLLKKQAKELGIDTKSKNKKQITNAINSYHKEQDIRKKEEFERLQKEKIEGELKFRTSINENMEILVTTTKSNEKNTTYLIKEVENLKKNPASTNPELIEKISKQLEELTNRINQTMASPSFDNLALDVLWEYIDNYHKAGGSKIKNSWSMYRENKLATEIGHPKNDNWKIFFNSMVEKGFLTIHPREKESRYIITPALIEKFSKEIEDKKHMKYLSPKEYKELLVDNKGKFKSNTFSKLIKEDKKKSKNTPTKKKSKKSTK